MDLDRPNRREKAAKAFSDATQLEKLLRAAAKDKGTFAAETTAVRIKTAACLERVLLLDHAYAMSKEVEATLWLRVWYQAISEFRTHQKALLSAKPKDPRALQLLAARLRSFLVDAAGFYTGLVRKMARVYGLKRVETHVLKEWEVWAVEVELDDDVEEGVEEVTEVGVREKDKDQIAGLEHTVHLLLVRLGDIARYRLPHLPLPARLPALPISNYLLALHLCPTSGLPHNQIAATWAQVGGKELEEAEGYVRGLFAPTPHPLAGTNLGVAFVKAREYPKSSQPLPPGSFDVPRWSKSLLATASTLLLDPADGTAARSTSSKLASQIPPVLADAPNVLPTALSLIYGVAHLSRHWVALGDKYATPPAGDISRMLDTVAVEWTERVLTAVGGIGAVDGVLAVDVIETVELVVRWTCKRCADMGVVPDGVWTALVAAINVVKDGVQASDVGGGWSRWDGYMVVADDVERGKGATVWRKRDEVDLARGRVLEWARELVGLEMCPIQAVQDGFGKWRFQIGTDGGADDIEVDSSQPGPVTQHSASSAFSTPAETFSDTVPPTPPRDAASLAASLLKPLNTLFPLSSPIPRAGTPSHTDAPSPQPAIAPEPARSSTPRTPTIGGGMPRVATPLPAPSPLSSTADIAGALMKGLVGIGGIGEGKAWGASGRTWEEGMAGVSSPGRAKVAEKSPVVTTPLGLGQLEQLGPSSLLRDIRDPFGTAAAWPGMSGATTGASSTGVGLAWADAFGPQMGGGGWAGMNLAGAGPANGPPSASHWTSSLHPQSDAKPGGELERIGADTLRSLGLAEDEAWPEQGMAGKRGPLTAPPGLGGGMWGNGAIPQQITSTSAFNGFVQDLPPQPHPELPLAATANEYLWPFGASSGSGWPGTGAPGGIVNGTSNLRMGSYDGGAVGGEDPIKKFARAARQANGNG